MALCLPSDFFFKGLDNKISRMELAVSLSYWSTRSKIFDQSDLTQINVSLAQEGKGTCFDFTCVVSVLHFNPITGLALKTWYTHRHTQRNFYAQAEQIQ